MSVERSTVVFLAGIVACLIAPVVFYFQFEVKANDTLRMVQIALRKEANRLRKQNIELSQENKELEVQVGRLSQQEEKLEDITSKQGTNVNDFVALVEENREILDELKTTMRADLTQTLVSACIDNDFDSSGNFSDQNIQLLEMRMQHVRGVKVNHRLLVDAVYASDRKLSSVLDLLDHLDCDELCDEDRIFHFNESTFRKG